MDRSLPEPRANRRGRAVRLAAVLGTVALVGTFLQASFAADSGHGTKSSATQAATPSTASQAPPDLAKQPTLYVVGYAHLDTEWRWEYPQVIQEYLSKTLRNNFALFEKYPHYIFNFTGANRYMMFKEYYPADYERLKQYV